MHYYGIAYVAAKRLVTRDFMCNFVLQDIKESAQPDVRHEISQLVKPMTQVPTIPYRVSLLYAKEFDLNFVEMMQSKTMPFSFLMN
jgi:hypothetical protein